MLWLERIRSGFGRLVTLRRLATRFAFTLAFAAATGACAGEVSVSYPVVPSTRPLPSTTTSTIGIDRTKVVLPTIDPAATTTSTIGFVSSSGSLNGVVSGPDGPVPGASIRIERLVGSQSVSTIVTADATGRYELKGVELGRVRVRAWHAPDLAMTTDDVFFSEAASTHDLTLRNYGRTDVQWAMAPSTPLVSQKVNIVVQVSSRVVDEAGKISVAPISGVGVSVFPQGVLTPVEIGERITNGDGRVIFTLRCDTPGTSALDIRLATGGQALVSPPPCVRPIVTAPPTVATAPTNPDSAGTTAVPIEVVTTVPVGPNPIDPAVSLVPVPVVPQQ